MNVSVDKALRRKPLTPRLHHPLHALGIKKQAQRSPEVQRSSKTPEAIVNMS